MILAEFVICQNVSFFLYFFMAFACVIAERHHYISASLSASFDLLQFVPCLLPALLELRSVGTLVKEVLILINCDMTS